MHLLEAKQGIKDELNNLVINKKIPILGICVGLQIMGFGSEEGELAEKDRTHKNQFNSQNIVDMRYAR